jgi:plasmid stability protein
VKLTFDLDPDTALKLRAMAQAQGRSVEDLVAEVLSEHASKYKRPRIPGIGKYDSGETDISERAEEILTEAAKRGGWH